MLWKCKVAVILNESTIIRSDLRGMLTSSISLFISRLQCSYLNRYITLAFKCAENTKNHCTADLIIFVWIKLLCLTCLVESKPVKQEVSSTLILPLIECSLNKASNVFQIFSTVARYTNSRSEFAEPIDVITQRRWAASLGKNWRLKTNFELLSRTIRCLLPNRTQSFCCCGDYFSFLF